jgi:hypothetical protein
MTAMRDPAHSELLEVGQRRPHAFILIFYAWAVAQGLALTFLPLFNIEPTPALAKIPDLIEASIGVFILVGAIMLNVGTWWPLSERWVLSKTWALERFGTWISMGGFFTFSMITLWASPKSLFAWLSPLIFAIALYTRTRVLGRREEVTRLVVKKDPGGRNSE